MQNKQSYLHINIEFDSQNSKLFDWLSFFNPEPVIISFAKNSLPKSILIRKIKWRSLDRNGNISYHTDRQEAPLKHAISLIKDHINAVNFDHYLKNGEPLPQKLHNFTIDEISWLLHTSTAKDIFAPPMAQKRHNEGIQIVLKDEHLTAAYLSFGMGIGLSSHNTTGVVPVTSQNLESALLFLKNHMEKNKENA